MSVIPCGEPQGDEGAEAMRLTIWNRPPAFKVAAEIDDSLALLAPLRADLVALQECGRPAAEDASVIWRGTDPHQGAAVVSTSPALPIEAIEIPSLHPTVVPVVVQAPQPFVFVGVWTHPPFDEVAWEAMTACVALADGMPVVAAGDFNVSPGVVGMKKAAPLFLQRMHDELGLVSAYHHAHDEAFGAETHATHYFQWKEAKPFHLDYCFVPEAWLGGLASVEVGSFADWTQSDHRPLTVEVTPGDPGDS